MRILVLGAGAIGGYFGGKLLAAQRDVTFLVRPARAAQLRQHGLVIRSAYGNVSIPAAPTVTADALSEPFDLILLSAKAYDVDSAIDSLAPAVGPTTLVLPLLNGMRHIDLLTARFGAEHVLGGLAIIAVTLDPDGTIVHLDKLQDFVCGELGGARTTRSEAVVSKLSGVGFDVRLSPSILQEMWEKWVFIAAGAGITCLMRASIGDIIAAGGTEFTLALLNECAGIASANGFPRRSEAMQKSTAFLTATGSPWTSSMLRDVQRGARTEVEHIIGDLVARGERSGVASPTLRMAYTHLKAYELQRRKTHFGADPPQSVTP
jgi:2-dehydropantoate 2-reductase